MFSEEPNVHAFMVTLKKPNQEGQLFDIINTLDMKKAKKIARIKYGSEYEVLSIEAIPPPKEKK